MFFTYFWIALVSFLVGLGFMFLGNLFFKKFGILDNPVLYGFKRDPVPYSMGVFLILSFLVLTFIFLNWNLQVISIVASVLVLGVVCFCDDIFKLSYKVRLFVQFLIAICLCLAGIKLQYVTNPIDFKVVDLGMFAFVVSVVWILSLINMINFLDGVSGLSSGVSSVGFLILFALSVIPGIHVIDQAEVSKIALIMFSLSLIGFIFEFPSPKLLVGDSGTMFYGIMLAILSMLQGGKLATVALVLLIPLLDGVWAIVRRVIAKRSPFLGDTEHMHHVLERIGLSKIQILFLYMILSLIFGLIAVFVWNTFFKIVSLLILISSLILVGYVISKKDYGQVRGN